MLSEKQYQLLKADFTTPFSSRYKILNRVIFRKIDGRVINRSGESSYGIGSTIL